MPKLTKKTEQKIYDTDNVKTPLNPIIVPLEEAKVRIGAWRTKYGETVKSKAFFIGVADLIGLLEDVTATDIPAVGIKAYLSIREEMDLETRELKPVEELLLVPAVLKVDPLNPPLLSVLDNIPAYDAGIPDTGFVYNLTSPCPPMCDYSSPLYQAASGEILPMKVALKDLKKVKSKTSSIKKK
ncbi:MAG: hypothetical protein QM737_05900 [Ferruginibacter sp.]